jgi:excinuclease ABC subunit C
LVPNPALKAHVMQHAEDRPGVYRMVGPGDELIYVGKSVRVRSRVLSYFRAEPGEKAGKLIRDTSRITWEYVPNEFAALVREMRLIKKWRPRYNVEHKRKRSFAFIKVTREPAPRILPVTRVIPDGGTYFGPFPRPRFLTQTLRDLAQILGLRDCPSTVPIFFDDQLEIFQRGLPPRCLRAETGTCLGPCFGACSARQYRDRAELARRFLEGRTREPFLVLQEEMEQAARDLEYEYAGMIRDRLGRLEDLQRELVAFRGRVESLSFVYRIPGFKGDDRLYLIRKGLVEGEMPHPRGREKRARAARRVVEVFSGPQVQPGSLTQEDASEILLVARWFRLREGELRRTSTPSKWLEEYGPSPSCAPPAFTGHPSASSPSS